MSLRAFNKSVGTREEAAAIRRDQILFAISLVGKRITLDDEKLGEVFSVEIKSGGIWVVPDDETRDLIPLNDLFDANRLVVTAP